MNSVHLFKAFETILSNPAANSEGFDKLSLLKVLEELYTCLVRLHNTKNGAKYSLPLTYSQNLLWNAYGVL